MWFFMVDVPCRSENSSYGENGVLFYQPVQEFCHFTKNQWWRTFFENLKGVHYDRFFRIFLDMLKRSRRTRSRRKMLSFIFFFVSRPNLTILIAKFLGFFSDPEKGGRSSSNEFKDGPPRCGSVFKLAEDFCTCFYNFPFVTCINFLKRLLTCTNLRTVPILNDR